jgi:hypothetical protein
MVSEARTIREARTRGRVEPSRECLLDHAAPGSSTGTASFAAATAAKCSKPGNRLVGVAKQGVVNAKFARDPLPEVLPRSHVHGVFLDRCDAGGHTLVTNICRCAAARRADQFIDDLAAAYRKRSSTMGPPGLGAMKKSGSARIPFQVWFLSLICRGICSNNQDKSTHSIFES